jgi:hypothetical protein
MFKCLNVCVKLLIQVFIYYTLYCCKYTNIDITYTRALINLFKDMFSLYIIFFKPYASACTIINSKNLPTTLEKLNEWIGLATY